MFSQSLMQHASPGMLLPEGGGGRLHGLVHGFESRVHLLAMYMYQTVCEASPLPFEWTVLLAVFTFITARQFVLWYTFDLKPDTNGYVYWHMTDLIDTEYTNSYKRANHLSTAMIVYITQKLWRDKPLTAPELKNKTFTIHLLSLHSKSTDAELEECYSEENLAFREHEELLVPVKLPIYPCWTPVHEDVVEVCTWISTTRLKNCYPEANRYIYIRARKDETSQGGAKADAALRRFVDNAVAFYFANGYGDRDDRALRMYRVSPSSGRIAVSAAPLPLAPTLDTVFFPQREAVRQQLQRFMEVKGRYAISGFPRKLGYLLYGPRGTGKRSFVRALAYHTRRHIVRIPLSGFTKNEQLYNTFHFEAAVRGSTEEWEMLSSRKVIFLLEDVDTESDAVAARGSTHVARLRRSRGLTAGNSTRGSEGDTLAQTTSATHTRDVEETVVTTKRRPRKATATTQVGWGSLHTWQDAKLDSIDLSSLLNVLDGAVEDPERIVVMITDRPERLDPALLRPGRLATHVRFDYLEMEELIGLCGVFYGAECLLVKGTLRNDGVAIPVAAQKKDYAYGRASTDGEGPLRFPHEAAEGEGGAEGSLVEHAPSVSSHVLPDWQRCGVESAAMAKLEEQVVRQLSSSQAAQVRACIQALEQKSNASHKRAGESGAFNFFITPAHAHHLCMRAATLEAFLSSLSSYIRNGVSGGA